MRVSKVGPTSLVLAFDRRAKCLRMVEAIHTDLVDQCGSVVTDYDDVDTTAGTLWRRDKSGRVVEERGLFYVVVKDEKAKELGRV